METIYHYKEIKDINDLQENLICFDPPEKGCDKRCDCKKCFKYEVTITKIEEVDLG